MGDGTDVSTYLVLPRSLLFRDVSTYLVLPCSLLFLQGSGWKLGSG